MIRTTLIAIAILSASSVFAGGGFGGNPPLLQVDAVEIMSGMLEGLPKAYADRVEFRRAQARLSVADAQLATMSLGGETIQVRKLSGSIVDEQVSKEILSQ